jgi:hypothetical protein
MDSVIFATGRNAGPGDDPRNPDGAPGDLFPGVHAARQKFPPECAKRLNPALVFH